MTALLPPGTRLFGGDYEVVAHLGSGAFADVYHVIAPAMGQGAHFAVKLIRPDTARGVASDIVADYEQRFLFESDLATAIHNPLRPRPGREHVIQVFRVGRDEALDAQCAVMELAAGGSLADRLAAKGFQPANQALSLLVGMLRGLKAIHDVGAIHRDIKPANILLAAGDVAKIGDFGLAQSTRRQQPNENRGHSLAGSVGLPHPGTPGYRSPEHEHPELLQPTSDIWSMGAVFFEVLTGLPWHRARVWGSTAREVIAELKARDEWPGRGGGQGGGDQVPADEIPDWLDNLVARMLLPTPGRDANQRLDETVRWVLVEDVIAAVEKGMAVDSEREAAARAAQAAAERATRAREEAARIEAAEAERREKERAEKEAQAMADAERRAKERAEEEERARATAARLKKEREAEQSRAREAARKKQAERRAATEVEYERIEGLARNPALLTEARAAWRVFRRTYPEFGDPQRVGSQLQEGKWAAVMFASVVLAAGMLVVPRLWQPGEGVLEPTPGGTSHEEGAAGPSTGESGAETHAADDTRADDHLPTPPESTTSEQRALLDEMLDFSRSAHERAEAGRELAAIGDPRPGVGLRADGLPDIEWVEIPGGAFLMGDDDEPPWSGGWKARREVSVETFHVSRYETTWAQYEAFLTADDGYRNTEWWDGLAQRQSEPGEQTWPIANHPAERVSWYDAVAYTRWMSARLGYEVRLPTEEEWEKAARGTEGRRYPWGDEYESGRANIEETWPPDDPAGPLYLERTTAVGIYLQDNVYGLADMSGNVWEWTLTEEASRGA